MDQREQASAAAVALPSRQLPCAAATSAHRPGAL